MFFGSGYFQATLHPWIAGSFVLALLFGYELGVRLSSAGDDLPWRTGLDAGLRLLLRQRGSSSLEWLPSAVLGVSLLCYSCRRWKERPRQSIETWSAMMVESILLALPLLFLARLCGAEAITSIAPEDSARNTSRALLLASIGAGVYEEVMFRWFLISCLMVLLRGFGLEWGCRLSLAWGLSAFLFALAHHLPPFQEPYHKTVFLFRFLAGAYFALLYWFRGLGIAAGVHACYDMMAMMN
ncbi:MAG: CPBP family intramembrane metalloprotease [Gemmatales bacterium]|nr:CPBP family intramembrane metalloprotease [Gemmatales bacterium]MDW8223920.1 CPBP family intramembrane glutamic endopeptidase [Gemmatales bacterium]